MKKTIATLGLVALLAGCSSKTVETVAKPSTTEETTTTVDEEAARLAAEAAEKKREEEANLIAFWYFDYERTLEAERLAAAEAERQRQAAAAKRVTYSSGNGNYLDCVRNRESRGDYGAVNGSSGAGGAYQFMPQTWNNTAAHAGRPDLIGVNPSQASPADQDAMAQHLYQWQGGSPWAGPGC